MVDGPQQQGLLGHHRDDQPQDAAQEAEYQHQCGEGSQAAVDLQAKNPPAAQPNHDRITDEGDDDRNNHIHPNVT